ncbi:MAG: DUF2157 domain-containing protein, partial [Flavobacteriales bacterium]|nr:DUF2157 domain-containing protein [Flavobacteriales bacterium]
VVAHNWDELPRSLRTILALTPMLIGQVLCILALRKQEDRVALREGASLFLAFAVAAALSLLAQTYHLPGSLEGFLYSWALLILVQLYAMRAAFTLMLYMAIIAWYAVLVRVDLFDAGGMPYYALLGWLLGIPALRSLALKNGDGARFRWAATFSALSLGIIAQLFWEDFERWHVLGPLGLALAYYLLPEVCATLLAGRVMRLGMVRWIGRLAGLGILFFFSWQFPWEDSSTSLPQGTDAIPWGLMIACGAYAYALSFKGRDLRNGSLFPEALVAFVLVLALGALHTGLAQFMTNLVLLVLGVSLALQGIKEGSMGRMNLGAAIVAVTVLMRFFDLDISYALRGVIFIGLGLAILSLNLRMMRRKRSHEA